MRACSYTYLLYSRPINKCLHPSLALKYKEQTQKETIETSSYISTLHIHLWSHATTYLSIRH